MGQNTAARIALAPNGGGITFLNVDDQGRLIVTSEVSAVNSVAAFSANEANAIATASLPAVAGQTNSLAGFIITGIGATAAGVVLASISGLVGGTLEIPVAVPAGVNLGITPIVVNFTQPLPASAADIAITITLPALGAGNTNAAVGIWGTVG